MKSSFRYHGKQSTNASVRHSTENITCGFPIAYKIDCQNREKYFNAQVANDKVMSAVSFDLKLWPIMEQSKEDKLSIALVNCILKI